MNFLVGSISFLLFICGIFTFQCDDPSYSWRECGGYKKAVDSLGKLVDKVGSSLADAMEEIGNDAEMLYKDALPKIDKNKVVIQGNLTEKDIEKIFEMFEKFSKIFPGQGLLSKEQWKQLKQILIDVIKKHNKQEPAYGFFPNFNSNNTKVVIKGNMTVEEIKKIFEVFEKFSKLFPGSKFPDNLEKLKQFLIEALKKKQQENNAYGFFPDLNSNNTKVVIKGNMTVEEIKKIFEVFEKFGKLFPGSKFRDHLEKLKQFLIEALKKKQQENNAYGFSPDLNSNNTKVVIKGNMTVEEIKIIFDRLMEMVKDFESVLPSFSKSLQDVVKKISDLLDKQSHSYNDIDVSSLKNIIKNSKIGNALKSLAVELINKATDRLEKLGKLLEPLFIKAGYKDVYEKIKLKVDEILKKAKEKVSSSVKDIEKRVDEANTDVNLFVESFNKNTIVKRGVKGGLTRIQEGLTKLANRLKETTKELVEKYKPKVKVALDKLKKVIERTTRNIMDEIDAIMLNIQYFDNN